MDRKPLKFAVLVPCYNDPKLRFAVCLQSMLEHFHASKFTDHDGTPIEKTLKTFWVSTSDLCQSRTKLIFDAMLWGADYALCLDADHTFPEDTLARLWARNQAIVGCNYARRIIPTAPTAAKFIADNPEDDRKALVYTTQEKAEANELEEVSHFGMGVCLLDMRIFDVLQANAEEKGETMLPLFKFGAAPDGKSPLGEDVHFFKKCRDAGFKVWCDHGLSWEVGHIHEIEISNKMACDHREKWELKTQETREKYDGRIEELSSAA